MKTKKIISVILSLALAVGVVSASVYEPRASVITTQELVPTVNDMDTLNTYQEFNTKVTDGAYVIPGLMSSVSYDKQLKRFATTQTMCPQAICKVGHYTLITAYDSATDSSGASISRSVVYVLDANNALAKTLVLPDSYHVGGIAYDSVNQLILITKASKSAVGIISLEDFNRYMNFSSAFVNVDYTIEENDSDNFIESASSVTYKNGLVYLATFGAGADSYAYCYTPVYDKTKNTYTLLYKYKMSLPSYTQGFSLSQYKGKLRLFASVSYGRNETKGIYLSYLYTYTFDDQTGTKTFDNVLSCPPMLELNYSQGGKLYCLFESASAIYRGVSRKPLSYVVPLKLSALCDEKQGSLINVRTSNVANGKRVYIDCAIPDAKIYYNVNMPYYSTSYIASAYSYKGSYLKQNSSMVYAVAVLNGRIIASDGAYISVSTASAPSNLKASKKTKNSVSLSWSAASNATSYEVYQSTSKTKNFKKVATVSASKKSYKCTKLKKNKTYYFKVRAVRNGYKNSKYTYTVGAKTLK